MTFTVPESDQIKLVDVLNEELIDNELMNEESTSIKCRFALLSPAAWVNWIKGQIGLEKSKIDVHVNKDDSKIYIRFFTLGKLMWEKKDRTNHFILFSRITHD